MAEAAQTQEVQTESALEAVRSPASPLVRSRLTHARAARLHHVATVGPEVVREDLTDPAFWKLVANVINPCDRIDVYAENMTWFAEMIVLGTGDLWVNAQILSFHNLEVNEIVDVSEYEVKWGNPTTKWGIYRLSDSERIFSGLGSRAEAERDLKDYVAALRR